MAELSFPRKFIVDHPLFHADGFGLIACIDRRLIKPGDPVLSGDRLFQQWRGGRWGIGDSIAHTMEANRPGSFTDLGISLAEFSQAIGTILYLKGLITTKHGPKCGAIESALAIHNGVVRAGEDPLVLQNAGKFKPDLQESAFVRNVEAAQRIADAGLLSSPQQIMRALTAPHNKRVSQLGVPTNITHAPAPHAELDDTDHDTVLYIADYRPNKALDRAAAHAEGWGAYYSSFGAGEQILSALPDPVQEAVGSVENLWDTEAVFMGRVASHDIGHIDEHGEFHQYQIEAIGR